MLWNNQIHEGHLMFIFASDLDQTLIYSENFVGKLSFEDKKGIELVETKNDVPISYMSREAIAKLDKINSRLIFIPVTTRSIEQYERIFLLKKIVPKYAVVSNGGNIFIDGRLYKDWNSSVHEKINQNCIPMEQIIKKFNEIKNDSWIISGREVESLFYYCIIKKDLIPHERLENFTIWLKENNWRVSLQGRKLYFIPQPLEKMDAIKYIADKEGVKNIISAGDSILDLNMLLNSNYAISPGHSELIKMELPGHIKFTQGTGLFSSEEILDIVESFIQPQ